MSAVRSPLPFRMATGTWSAIAAAVIYFIVRRYRDIMQLPALNHALGPDDPDPWLRLAQVRQFLTDGSFFEHLVRNTNAPLGGIETPWTRPFDLLLVFFTRFTPADLAINTRVMLAAAWAPPLLGLAALVLLAAAGRRIFAHTHTLWCLVLLAAFNPGVMYFAPGAADHHCLLVTLWCGIIFLLARPLTTRGGIAAGAILGLMLWISPESLLLIAAIYILLGVEVLRHPERAGPLAMTAIFAALVAWIGLFVEMPAAVVIKRIVYDTLSLPYAVAMSFAAAGAALLALLSKRGTGMQLRIQSVVASGLVTVGAMAWWFPKFFKGPMAEVDPFIFTDFLPNVVEAQPLHAQPAVAVMMHLWQPLLAAFIFCATGRRHTRYGVLLLVTACMTFASARWTYYLQPVALVILAAYLPAWCVLLKSLRRIPRFFRFYVFIWVALFLFFGLVSLVPASPKRDACRAEMRYLLQSGQVADKMGKTPRTVFTDSSISGQMLFYTPHKIIAGNYHREGAGLRALKDIAAETKTAAAKKKLAARKADALFICPSSYKKQSWLYGLDKKTPDWLQPVTGLNYTKKEGPKPLLFTVK